MWHWDQGHLAYFQFDALRAIAAFAEANDFKKADGTTLLAATGLPFPLDLVDENVSLPENLTREFVEEVEALLIKDKELNKISLQNHFLSINPQKEE